MPILPMRAALLIGLATMAAAYTIPTAQRTHARAALASSHQLPARHLAVQLKEVDDDFDYDRDWAKRLFTPENAGPWLILVVVLGLQAYNAIVPSADMPPFIQELIPKILGAQYQRPVM